MRPIYILLLSAMMSIQVVAVHAAVVEFSVKNIAGNSWRYDYSITAEATDKPIKEFSIYFGSSYENLNLISSSAGWDSIVIQPVPSIPADGYFDGLSLTGGLSAGSTASGFGVTFDFSGLGTPSSQSFQIIDPLTFDVISSGLTVADTPSEIPEPSTLLLLAFAGPLLRRKIKSNERK